jgi:uncharacterized membrane protein YbhN (UPF0104 family)
MPSTRDAPAPNATITAAASGPRRRAWAVLRIVLPLAVLVYLFSITSLAELQTALRSVSLATLAGAFALFTATLVAGALRWRLLLRACGAAALPSVLELTRLYWVGTFYGTFLPSGLGGEVVRGAATRKLFGQDGSAGLTKALGVVMLERVLGLTGLLLIVTVTLVVAPLPIPNVLGWTLLGWVAIVGCLLIVLLAPRLAARTRGLVRRVLSALPAIGSLTALAGATALSVATQAGPVVMGHWVLVSIAPQVTWSQSLVIMPLVLAAQFFPLTIAGAGVREAAFVAFYGLVGVPRHDALAASLVVAALTYVTAAFGGVLQLIKPITVDAD